MAFGKGDQNPAVQRKLASSAPIVSGPAYSGATSGPTPDDIAQAQAEASAYKILPGQDAANDFLKAHTADGIEEAREAGGIPEQIFLGAPVDTAKPLTDAQVREMFAPDFGLGTVSPRLQRDYGINPDTEVPAWSLADNYNNTGRNFVEEWLENNPRGRVCYYSGEDPEKQGKKCTRQGMVMMALPRVDAEMIERRWASFDPGNVDNGLDGLPANEKDIDERSPIMAQKREQTQRAIEAMLKGSPSAGLGADNLDRAMQFFTPEDTAAHREAARWPRGSGSGTDAVQNARDATAENLKGAASGKKTFAMGASFDAAGRVVR